MTLNKLSNHQVNAIQPSKELINHIKATMLTAKTEAEKEDMEPPPLPKEPQKLKLEATKGGTEIKTVTPIDTAESRRAGSNG